MRKAITKKLDEFSDNTLVAQHFRHGKHQVRRGCAFAQLAGQFEAHNVRDQHGNGLAEHRRFGLDAPDTPAQDAKAVDHCRVRVRTDHGVRVGASPTVFFCIENNAAQIFQVDLVHDTGVRRDDAEILEC